MIQSVVSTIELLLEARLGDQVFSHSALMSLGQIIPDLIALKHPATTNFAIVC
jgi:hypothetical protein